ncbi:hypothetical protein [Dictyobacter aurantiacus]|uniref:Lipoprotein n=1 Tax=Dictyobacter aurantiacus TaxID=1936993 RepID=A0A401ZP15_9CHLR|nr:hypothetical protein [Dictyobacter aurantiacus]GCE08550.1 hypothetical protein KDAU_58790 [Dictyobacter aurantiacus]
MRKGMRIGLSCCVALLLLLLVSACSNVMSPTTTHNVQAQTRTLDQQKKKPTPEALTPLQILQKSSNAMNSLTGVHFTLDAKRQNITPDSTTPNPSGNILQTLQTLQPLPGAAAYNNWKEGSGDDAGTNGSQIHLKEQTDPPLFQPHSGYTFTMDQHQQGNDNTYLLGEPIVNQKWYMISTRTLVEQPATQIYALSGMSQVKALLQLTMQAGKVSNKGLEKMNGSLLRHIHATFAEEDRTALRAIDVENYSSFFASIQTQNTSGSSDFWIDPATDYVYRASSTVVYKTTEKDAMPTVTMQQTLTFNCNQFNQPVIIQIPTHPIPANDINQIYHYQA